MKPTKTKTKAVVKKVVSKVTKKTIPQRKPNKVMKGEEMLAKGMAKLGGGHG